MGKLQILLEICGVVTDMKCNGVMLQKLNLTHFNPIKDRNVDSLMNKLNVI